MLARLPHHVVVLPGNHDPLLADASEGWERLAEHENLVVVGLPAETVVFPELGLEIWGRPHRDYSDMRPLSDPPARGASKRIAVAHGHFSPKRPAPNELAPAWLFFPDELASLDADYVALGHWNVARQVGPEHPPAYYSGSWDYAGSVNIVRLTEAGAEVSRLSV